MVPRAGPDAWEKESLTRVGNQTTIPRLQTPAYALCRLCHPFLNEVKINCATPRKRLGNRNNMLSYNHV